jgi:hypothetical protein
LYDTIINFGENLPETPLQRAWEVCRNFKKYPFFFEKSKNEMTFFFFVLFCFVWNSTLSNVI